MKIFLFSLLWCTILPWATSLSFAQVEEKNSLAIFALADTSENLSVAQNLQDLLTVRLQKEWNGGAIVEREAIEKILDELAVQLSLKTSDADILRTGKMLGATWLLQVKAVQNTVCFTLLQCRNGTVLYEKKFSRNHPVSELLEAVANDSVRVVETGQKAGNRLKVSIGAFIDMTPFHEHLQMDMVIHQELRKRLLQNNKFVINERLTPAPLLSELELKRQGYVVQKDSSASINNFTADVLVTGLLKFPESIDLNQREDELEIEVILASPNSGLPARHVTFIDSDKNTKGIILRIQQELMDYAKIVQSAKSEFDHPRDSFTQANASYKEEASFFREAGLQIMPWKPYERSKKKWHFDRGRSGVSPGILWTTDITPHWQAIRAFENAMLFDESDALLRVWTGATLWSMARIKYREIDIKTTHRGFEKDDPEIIATGEYYENVLQTGIDYLLLGHAMDPNYNSRGHIKMAIRCCRGYYMPPYNEKPDAPARAAARLLKFVIDSGVEGGWDEDYVKFRAPADLIVANRDLDSALQLLETSLQKKKRGKYLETVISRLNIKGYCMRRRFPPTHLQKIKETARRLIADGWPYAAFIGHDILRVMLDKQDDPDCIQHIKAMIKLKESTPWITNDNRGPHSLLGLKRTLAHYRNKFFNEPIDRITPIKQEVANIEDPEDYKNLYYGKVEKLLKYYCETEQYQECNELATKYIGYAVAGNSGRIFPFYLKSLFALQHQSEPHKFGDLPKIELPPEVKPKKIRRMTEGFGRIWLVAGEHPTHSNPKGKALWIDSGTNANEANLVPGLESEFVIDVAVSPENLCFAAYDGLFKVDPVTGGVEHFNKKNSGLPDNRTKGIWFTEDKFCVEIWRPGMRNDLYYLLSPDFRSLTKIDVEKVRKTYHRKTRFSQEGYLFYSPIIYSHSIQDTETGKMVFSRISRLPLSSGRWCRALALWQNRLWFGYTETLASYNLRTGELRIVCLDEDKYVYSLLPDDNRLLVGTSDGLRYIDTDVLERLQSPLLDIIPLETEDRDRFGDAFVDWHRAGRYMAKEQYRKAAAAFQQISFAHRDTVFQFAAVLNQALCEKNFDYNPSAVHLSPENTADRSGPFIGQAYLYLGEKSLVKDFELLQARRRLVRAKNWKEELPTNDWITNKFYEIPKKAEAVTKPPANPEFLDFELVPATVKPYMIVNDRTVDWYLDRLTARALYLLGLVKAVENDWQAAREMWKQAFEINDKMLKADAEHFNNLKHRLMEATEKKEFIATATELEEFSGHKYRKIRLKIMLAGFYTITEKHQKANELYTELDNYDSLTVDQNNVIKKILAKTQVNVSSNTRRKEAKN